MSGSARCRSVGDVLILDVNVLTYAVNEDAQQHSVTRGWLDSVLQTPEIVGIPWIVGLGFIRLATSPRVMSRPATPDAALRALEGYLQLPTVVTPEPTARHFDVLRGLLLSAGTAGNLTTDAHIAALAVEYGARVATFDRDFARFDITVVVPS